jgi:hypothetical protein
MAAPPISPPRQTRKLPAKTDNMRRCARFNLLRLGKFTD